MTPRSQNTRRTRAAHSVSSTAKKTRAGAEAGSGKGHSYKPLPKQFRRAGFVYRQLAREGDIANYAQAWCGCPDSIVCYELVRVRQRDGFNIDGRFGEPAEVYPRSEAWGFDGFTLTDKDSAFAKLRELANADAAPSRFEVKEVA